MMTARHGGGASLLFLNSNMKKEKHLGGAKEAQIVHQRQDCRLLTTADLTGGIIDTGRGRGQLVFSLPLVTVFDRLPGRLSSALCRQSHALPTTSASFE